LDLTTSSSTEPAKELTPLTISFEHSNDHREEQQTQLSQSSVKFA
jgi:hypothetical protein